MRVYISDIKESKEAQLAIEWGASAVGLRIGYGLDDVHPEKAREIFMSIPLFVSRVGIFNNEKRYNIQELITFCHLDSVHYTGSETPDELKDYSEHLIKNFSAEQVKDIPQYPVEAVCINIDRETCLMRSMLPQDKKLIVSGIQKLDDWWKNILIDFQPFAVKIPMAEAGRELVRNLLVL
ncbi:MAG: hypothetical protein ACOYI2_00785 [Bacillota bacterium]|jgi:phosphoribosylanthranilate isomerase|nr:hypothetical protein [Clostridia bacterium]